MVVVGYLPPCFESGPTWLPDGSCTSPSNLITANRGNGSAASDSVFRKQQTLMNTTMTIETREGAA